MSRNEDFNQGHTPNCASCGKSTSDGHFHVELPKETVEMYQQIANASRMQAQMDEHMRTAPTRLDDIHSLRQHLMTGDHESPFGSHNHFVQNASLEDLQSFHKEDHDEYPDESHTTLGHEHFHH